MRFQLAMLCLVLAVVSGACKKAPVMGQKQAKAAATDQLVNLPQGASLASFKANVYEPILQHYCGSCHATTFAGSKVEDAHNNFLLRVGFDKFSGVDQTPVVLKMKQSHNCWEGQTSKCVDALTNAIDLWLLDLEAAGYKPTPAVYPIATRPVALTDAKLTTIAFDSTQYARAGVDTATLAEPFAKGSNDIDGAIETYVMGKAGTTAITAVNQAQATQAVTFNVDVKTPGTYQVWARVKTLDAAKNGFFIRINNANVVFNTPVTGDTWKWVQLTRIQNMEPVPITMDVGAAAVVPIPILFRAAEAKINMIVLTRKIGEFDGEQFANRYMDISVDLPIPGARIIATIWEKTTEVGKRSLGVKELRIDSSRPIHVKTIYPLINGLFHLNHGTYTLVDTVAGGSTDRTKQVIQTGGSTSTTWIADLTKDQISFAFEAIAEAPP